MNSEQHETKRQDLMLQFDLNAGRKISTRLCREASIDLARCEALFNMADAKVPQIQ